MADYNSYENLLIEIKDGIALLTINRPEVYNATDFKLHNELSRIWLDLGRDDDVRVAVIRPDRAVHRQRPGHRRDDGRGPGHSP